MTQEEKEKLLKYLCMALPYRVKVQDDMGRVYELPIGNTYLIDIYYGHGGYVEAPIKPYLRPMSSMTKEELKEFYAIEDIHSPVIWNKPQTNWRFSIKGIEWLLENHFDFMGRIPMDCAIEITNENNPYKD